MYFQGCSTVGQVKSEYRRLAKLHHPDVGGVTAIMQAINAAYHNILESLNGQTRTDQASGREYTYRYKRDVEQAVIDKLGELLGLQLGAGVTIEIVGLWIWVYGDTRPVRAKLGKNGAKMRWHSKRQKWYWKPYSGASKYRGVSFSALRDTYGSRRFQGEDEQANGPPPTGA